MAGRETSVGDVQRASFEAERAQVEAALSALAAEARAELDRVTGTAKEMTAVFRSAAFKKALAADPELAPVVDRSKKVFEQDEAALKDAAAAIAARKRTIGGEFKKLAALLP